MQVEQVPKHSRNLRRELAFDTVLMEQVPYLKLNLRRLRLEPAPFALGTCTSYVWNLRRLA
jgi:hypothetical protein